jgi:pimeloyl-ACP methyl ester carboxylesterase
MPFSQRPRKVQGQTSATQNDRLSNDARTLYEVLPANLKVVVLLLACLAVSACAVRLSPPTLSHRYTYEPTTTINYEVHGEGDRSLVLLHGFGASLETWRDIEPLLAAHYTLFLLDLKGFGRSSKPKDNRYAADDQAAIVTRFVRDVVKSNVTFVGNSFGGAVALKAYLRLRNTSVVVDRLVLIDAAAYHQAIPWFVRVLRWPIINHAVFLMPATTRASMVLHKAFADDGKVTDERVRRHAQFLDLPGAHYALRKTAQALVPNDDFATQLAGIDASTLVLWGKQDEIIPVSNAQRFVADLKHAQLILLDHTGHAPQEEAPHATATAIIEFLSH